MSKIVPLLDSSFGVAVPRIQAAPLTHRALLSRETMISILTEIAQVKSGRKYLVSIASDE